VGDGRCTIDLLVILAPWAPPKGNGGNVAVLAFFLVYFRQYLNYHRDLGRDRMLHLCLVG